MNLEDSIVSTISDAKPMMILALCTIVLFVIVASLIEAWLAKARKAKSEADTLPSGPEASQRSVEKSEAVEQAVDNAGGFDLDERRKARAPKSIPDRRPWFFKTVMGRGLVCLLTKVIPILLPVVWFSLVVMGMLPNPLALFFFSPDPQRMNVVSPSSHLPFFSAALVWATRKLTTVLPPAVRLGSRSETRLPMRVMGIWLIVAMIGPFFRIAAHVVGLSFSLHRMSIFHVPTQSHACSLNLACCWAVYGFSRRVEHSAREVFRPACVYEA